jgi:hypothetical protein
MFTMNFNLALYKTARQESLSLFLLTAIFMQGFEFCFFVESSV